MILTVNGKQVIGLTGHMSLSSSVDTLGDQLNFSVAHSAPYLVEEISAGSLVQLFDSREVFRGIVVSATNGQKSRDCSCFDFAFYLNKSKVIKQFQKIRADEAIRQLLAQFNVPIGEIAGINVVISKIYYDKEVSEVIKDILTEAKNATGISYTMEMSNGKLDIYRSTDKIVKATVKLAENLNPVDCMKTISNPSKSTSIENMRNSVKVYIGNEDGVKVYAEAKNQTFIDRYGLLQETQSIEDKDKAQAKNIATNLLSELGKVESTASVTVLGSFDLRAGRIVEINEPEIDIVGRYRITSASHNIGKTYTTTLDLEAV